MKLIGMLAFLTLASCMKPVRVDPIKEIEPNETAFVVPLEMGTEDQAKFESVDFLKKQQVAAKRIVISQRERQIGRFGHEIEWIPTVRVITVNRSPVTRSWIYSPRDYKEGVNLSNKTFGVESKDSIGFSVGVNISAYIEENDAATYLYYYRGGDLADVMDRNVREKVHTILSAEFAERSLSECKTDKNPVTNVLNEKVAQHFKKFGITITSIGLAEGLVFDQKEIQDSINANYVAEMAVEQAKQKTLEQAEINKRLIATATGEKAAALEFASAAEERRKLVDIEIQKMKAQALLTAAQKWNGQVPTYMGGGKESFLLDIK